MKRIAVKALVATTLLSGAAIASATSTNATTAQLNVSATVNPTCIINSAGAMTFAAYDPSTPNAQTTSSSISVNCTNTTPFNIGLSAGGGAGATVTNRVMTSGTNTLNYSLYQDTGHASVWGNTVGTDTVAAAGLGMASGNAIVKTVYGQIPLQPNAIPGNYSDTVTVTVSY